jgi:hypothetical protein
MNLLKWKGEKPDRAQFAHFKKEIKEEGRSWWGATLDDENGDKLFLTQEGLEGLILNGEVFHSDQGNRKALASVVGNAGLLKAVAFFNYMRFARTVVYCAQKTAELIRLRGYLA